MVGDYIDTRKKEMIDRLIDFIRFPSVAEESEDGASCGAEVERAQDWFVELASSMGFKARRTGKCAEVLFGGEGVKKPKVYIAAHADVVPVGDGWTGNPFTAVIRNGKIYGRGVLDDKGPALAVLYSMKALKELGIEPKADIRLIVGGCEETDMTDLKEYVEKNGLPDYGLTPDSSYPIIHAEAGTVFGRTVLKNCTDGKKLILKSLHAGQVYNAVPDLCTALLSVADEAKNSLSDLLKKAENAEFRWDGNDLHLSTFGKAAHGSVPDSGINAAFRMIGLLETLYAAVGEKNSFLDFGQKWLVGDTKGERIGIACEDEPTGSLSHNVGMVEYSDGEKSGYYSFDIRVPVTLSVKPVSERLTAFAAENGAEALLESVKESFYIDPESEFLTKLAACYEKITGKKGECLAAKGGTYAKAFGGRGVAFGPIDEEDPEAGGNIHGIDEYISVDAYIELAKVYAEAIRVLWC